jgi:hypothetical protein
MITYNSFIHNQNAVHKNSRINDFSTMNTKILTERASGHQRDRDRITGGQGRVTRGRPRTTDGQRQRRIEAEHWARSGERTAEQPRSRAGRARGTECQRGGVAAWPRGRQRLQLWVVIPYEQRGRRGVMASSGRKSGTARLHLDFSDRLDLRLGWNLEWNTVTWASWAVEDTSSWAMEGAYRAKFA